MRKTDDIFTNGPRKKNDDTDKSKHRRLRHRPEIRRESKRRVCRWVVNRRRDIRRARVFVRAAVKQTHLEREKVLDDLLEEEEEEEEENWTEEKETNATPPPPR